MLGKVIRSFGSLLLAGSVVGQVVAVEGVLRGWSAVVATMPATIMVAMPNNVAQIMHLNLCLMLLGLFLQFTGRLVEENGDPI